MLLRTLAFACLVGLLTAERGPVISSLYPQISPRKIGGGFHTPYQSGAAKDNVVAPVYEEKTKPAYEPTQDDLAEEVTALEKAEQAIAEESQTISPENYSVAFMHLFEIIQDVLNVMRQMNTPQPMEKTGDAEGMDTWPMLKRIFRRYLALIRDTELLTELREIIPVDKLDEALERDDSELLTKAIIQSFNPSMIVYAFNTLKALVMPLAGLADSLTDGLDVAQLREYIPNTPSIMDITYPIRYLVHKGLDLFYFYFNNNEMRRMWRSLQSINPFGGRSLSDDYYLESEYDINTIDGSEDLERSATSSPYMVAAGLGSTVVASIFAYNYMMTPSQDPEIHNRIRRDVISDPLSSLDEANVNIDKLVEFLEKEDPYEKDTTLFSKKEKKNNVPKKYKDSSKVNDKTKA